MRTSRASWLRMAASASALIASGSNDAAGGLVLALLALPRDDTVDQNMMHPSWLVSQQPALVAGQILDQPDLAGRDIGRIEHGDVGEIAPGDPATLPEAEQFGGLTSQLANRGLERHHAAIAHPIAEHIGRQHRIAGLSGMGAGIRQAEYRAFDIQ